MAKAKSSKRAKATQAEAPSSSLTINDLPNEVLPTILRNLSSIQQLDCMHLNEGFYLASLDNLKNSTLHLNVQVDVLEAACQKENFNAVKAILEKPEVKNDIRGIYLKQLAVFKAAARTGNLRICQFLLMEAVGRLHVRSDIIQAALYESAKNCHEDVSLYFLQQGAQLSALSGLLRDAARTNDLKCAQFVLGLNYGTSKININDTSGYSFSALHSAVSGSHAEMVQLLLDHGADVNNRIYHGNRSTIMFAKKEDITRLLLSKNPDLSAVSSRDLYTVLHYAAKNNNVVLAEEVLKFFTEQGKTIDNRSNKGKSPLHVAVENGSNTMVKWLVENGADVNAVDKSGSSPVLLAKRVQTIRLLIELGADMHVLSFKNGSVLHTLCTTLESASDQPYDDVLDAIVESGLPLSAVSTSLQKKTALHLAAQHGQTAILKRLIESGADINPHTSTGYTPLHLAAKKNKEACVEALLEAGAVTHIKTAKGRLAKDFARAKVRKVFERVEKEREEAKEAKKKKKDPEKSSTKKSKKKEPKRKAEEDDDPDFSPGEKRPARKRKRT